jgi:glycosidase
MELWNNGTLEQFSFYVLSQDMKKLIIFLLFGMLFYACTKPDSDRHIVPPNDDTTSFSIPLTEDIVMYEVNLRALTATGDIAGVMGRLNEIKTLGINVIWLMPIHPIGEINSVNSPYSVKNYKAVNPEFGTTSDLLTLVKKAHQLDMAVIIDWVANHTAWDNPWIANTDWYTQDGQGNIISPPGTNWADVADLNYSNQVMRLSMIDAMEYWVSSVDIDGFRCDAADMVPVDFWIQAIDSVNKITKKDLIWLAEGGSNNLFSAGFQMNYSWTFYSKLKDVFNSNQSASTLVTVHNQEYSGLPAGKQKLRFTTNHDESAWDATPMTLFGGEKGALAASVAAIYLGGVPMIYGSQEVGVPGTIPFFSNSTIDWSAHPEMLQAYKDMLNFYDSSAALKKGDLTSFASADVLAFTRKYEQEEVFVIDNLRNANVSYDIPAGLENSVWLDAFDGREMMLGSTIELEPYRYFVLKK